LGERGRQATKRLMDDHLDSEGSLGRPSRPTAGPHTALPFAEFKARRPPIAPRPSGPAGAWLRASRHLYGPLRRLRTKLMLILGRPVHCEVCGEVLFRGLPFIWHGRLKLLGAESALVRCDWDKMNRMTFRHVEADRCRPQ